MLMLSPCCATRPVSKVWTCSASPVFWISTAYVRQLCQAVVNAFRVTGDNKAIAQADPLQRIFKEFHGGDRGEVKGALIALKVRKWNSPVC
jgi:hypothetical protein